MNGISNKTAYRIGVGFAVLAGFLQVWINVAVGVLGEDSPGNQGFFGVVVSAMACAWVVRFEAAGMARAMVGTAGVQAALAAALATAPIYAHLAPKVLLFSAGLIALWLIAAVMFQRSARRQAEPQT